MARCLERTWVIGPDPSNFGSVPRIYRCSGLENVSRGAARLGYGHRNADGPDSLEMVIQTENLPESLPIITLANPKRIIRDRVYAERVAERVLDYLTRIDELLGAGRLYAP